MSIPDFKEVAAAALAMAPILLHEWLGGQRKGQEWVGARKANGGLGDSWAINLATGHWLHGAGDERGGDLISLYAALNHVDQKTALVAVAERTGSINPSNVLVLPRARLAPKAPDRIPDVAPPVPPHVHHGPHTALYYYGRAFVIARYDLPTGKMFCPFTWRDGRWWAKGHPDPKPLYGAELLPKYESAPVLIVEGEKCADSARAVLRAYVVMTWAGGASAVKKSDWSVLKDRDVILWPDADEPGARAVAAIAEILLPIAKRVRVIVPGDRPAGWDVADAIAEGWDARALTTWATSHIKTVTIDPDPVPVSSVAHSPTAAASSISRAASDSTAQVPDQTPPSLSDSALANWQSLGLDCNQGGVPHATAANASLIVQAHPALRGRIWYDTFRSRIYHTVNRIDPAPWTEDDTLNLTVMIQQSLRIAKFNTRLVSEGVKHAALRAGRNSLTDWLDSLEWDGISRLDHWLSDCLGVEYNEYSMAVARNWPIGMVARAYVPGCKMDHMPVLEGVSGLSKTSFLEALGDPWYKSLSIAFGEKDFLQAIQGAWLIEIPDMTGFTRREHTQILATITVRTDNYRPSYGMYTEEHPRVATFAATSETDDYLQDTRGRRRYWPLRCQEISLDTLRMTREQIFAEAVREYRKGAKWWEMPADAADDEQLQRAAPDLWTDKVIDYCDNLRHQGLKATSSQILYSALDIPLGRQEDTHKKRIARIMRENGWSPTRTGIARYWQKKDKTS